MARAFIALLLDAATRQTVAAEIERLRPLSRAVAWVPAPNLHLTLKFLGEQSVARLDEARSALQEVAAGLTPFTIVLHGVGAFPAMERPRIVWVGVGGGAPEVCLLQARVEAALEGAGFPREARSWHPHLTIGRVFDERRWRRELSPALREALVRAATADFGSLPATALALIRSDLSPRGARYSELASVSFAGRA